MTGDGWQARQDLAFGPGETGDTSRNYALLTVTVSGTESLSYSMPRASRGASMNGFSVRVVDRQPPSTARPGPRHAPDAVLRMPDDIGSYNFV